MLCMKVYKAIFSNQKEIVVNKKTFKRHLFAGGTLRGFDIENWRYIEQNPAKSSKFGLRAKKGAKIMWIIRTTDNFWAGRVEDEILYRKGAQTT